MKQCYYWIFQCKLLNLPWLTLLDPRGCSRRWIQCHDAPIRWCSSLLVAVAKFGWIASCIQTAITRWCNKNWNGLNPHSYLFARSSYLVIKVINQWTIQLRQNRTLPIGHSNDFIKYWDIPLATRDTCVNVSNIKRVLNSPCRFWANIFQQKDCFSSDRKDFTMSQHPRPVVIFHKKKKTND